MNTTPAHTLYTKEESREAFNLANLIFNPAAMSQLQSLCDALSSQSGIIPDHFLGKPNDVMAVVMQAARWGLEPFTVMQSTFVIGGKIGYEAKIIQSVASANGGVTFDTEYYGDWSRINGNTRKFKKSKTGRNGPYQVEVDVPNWTAQDEVGVGIRTTGTFPDGRQVTIEVDLNTCFPRHSTNWTYDPMTQIHYTSVKRWVRRYAPHLGAGIKDYDDLNAMSDRAEKEINPVVIKPKQSNQIDDLLNEDDKPSVESLLVTIEAVETPTDFESVRDQCTTAVASGKLSEADVMQVRTLLETKRKMINQELDNLL